MQIFVKNTRGRTCTFVISPEEYVKDFKYRVYHRCGVKPQDQNLVYNGRTFNPNMKLKHYGVEENCTLHLLGKLYGD